MAGGSVHQRLIGLAIGFVAPISVVLVCGQSTRTAPAQAPDVTAQRAVVDRYCVVCHNAKLLTGNLALDKLDLAHLGDHAETGEKVVRKLRAGMMPPAGMPRPDPATLEALISSMEQELDRSGVTYLPPPGRHRLNRTEYT